MVALRLGLMMVDPDWSSSQIGRQTNRSPVEAEVGRGRGRVMVSERTHEGRFSYSFMTDKGELWSGWGTMKSDQWIRDNARGFHSPIM
jgi:hypothetical protein